MLKASKLVVNVKVGFALCNCCKVIVCISSTAWFLRRGEPPDVTKVSVDITHIEGLTSVPPSHQTLQAKTHEKVDSIGEERSIGCHAVIMLIRKDLAPPPETLDSEVAAAVSSSAAAKLSTIDSGFDLDIMQ